METSEKSRNKWYQSNRSMDVGTVTRGAEMEKKMMEMMDQRMGEILEQVLQPHGGKLEELTQVIAAINLQNQKNKAAVECREGSSGGIRNEGGGNRNEGGNDWGRSTRYEFPKFDEDGFEGWMMRAEYFFQVAKVPDEEKVRIAAIHLKERRCNGIEDLRACMEMWHMRIGLAIAHP